MQHDSRTFLIRSLPVPLIAAALLVLLLVADARADQGYAISKRQITAAGSFLLLDGAAINVTQTVTVTLTASGNAVYTKLKVQIDFTHSTASAIVIAWKCSLDGTTFPDETARNISAGTITAYTDTVIVSGDFNIMTTWGTAGCQKVRFTIDGDVGANAGDLVDVQATAVVGE